MIERVDSGGRNRRSRPALNGKPLRVSVTRHREPWTPARVVAAVLLGAMLSGVAVVALAALAVLLREVLPW